MATYPDGTLLKATGPEVARMEGGQRRWIPDPQTFNCMGLNWGAIQTISDSEWNQIPKGTPYPSRADTTLLQGSGPRVYVVAGCQRHWIPDPETFNAHGYKWSAIQHVSDADLTAIPEGAPLPSVHAVAERARTQDVQTTSTRENQTELDQTITGIPWRKGFDYGVGIDAITGSLTGTAIKKFTPSNPSEKSSWERYRFIQSKSDLNQEIEASASGKYNIEGVDVSASTEFLHKIKFSDLSTTLIAEYESHQNGYDQAESYELTDEAEWLMGDEPAAFRRAYGDYFIAGGLRRSRFLALYRCQASSAESLISFKASLGAEVPNVFSAEGSAKFMQAASRSNVSISIDLALEGYVGQAPSGPWTPEKVLEALAWFKGAEKGVHLEALLKHYSTIDPTYSRTIPIAPSVFTDLRQLYLKVWDIRSLYASFPPHYQQQLRNTYTDLDTGVPAHQSVLPTDAASRQGYQQRADTLLGQLTKIRARQDFYSLVRAQAGKEPGQGAEIGAGPGQGQWMYGLSTYPQNQDVSKEILKQEMHYTESWTIGHREHTFEFGPDGRYLIVGWQVISHWTDGLNGSWWKATNQILASDHAAVHVKSQYDRGCNWGLRVYYVEAKDYQF